MNCANNYIPQYVPDNLPWYERGGLITYINKVKYENFMKDTDKHFENTQIVNFDKIHRQASEEKIDSDPLKRCKTIDSSIIDQYLDKEKTRALSSAFWSPRKDIFLKKEVIDNHFKQDK